MQRSSSPAGAPRVEPWRPGGVQTLSYRRTFSIRSQGPRPRRETGLTCAPWSKTPKGILRTRTGPSYLLQVSCPPAGICIQADARLMTIFLLRGRYSLDESGHSAASRIQAAWLSETTSVPYSQNQLVYNTAHPNHPPLRMPDHRPCRQAAAGPVRIPRCPQHSTCQTWTWQPRGPPRSASRSPSRMARQWTAPSGHQSSPPRRSSSATSSPQARGLWGACPAASKCTSAPGTRAGR